MSRPVPSANGDIGAVQAYANRLEIFLVFLQLELTSFGGPIAHLGYFRQEFVERRKWLNEQIFADLVALCNFLPGPTSSQVSYSIGMTRAGISGALCAWGAFTLPSAIIMLLAAYGIHWANGVQNTGWLHGLKIVAVAVVAQAVWSMATKLCPDRIRITLAFIATVIILLTNNEELIGNRHPRISSPSIGAKRS